MNPPWRLVAVAMEVSTKTQVRLTERRWKPDLVVGMLSVTDFPTQEGPTRNPVADDDRQRIRLFLDNMRRQDNILIA